MKKVSGVVLLLLLLVFAACKKDEKKENTTNNQNTGTSASDILSGKKYGSILLEVQYPENYAPPAGALDDLKAFISTYCRKPGGVEVSSRQIAISPQDHYSLQDVEQIEDENRTAFNTENRLAIYVLLLGGNYAEDGQSTSVLGVAYRNTSFAVFQKTVKDHSGGLAQASEELMTSTVFQHEMGHLMGLVNVGTPMQTHHQDTEHPHHCKDDSCLMYWAAESGDAIFQPSRQRIPSCFGQCL